MMFEFYYDFRAASEVRLRRNSWMGAETSGSTFSGEVVVEPGITLTLWQGTDIFFAGGLVVEPGGHLIVEDGVSLTIGDGQVLGGHGGLITIGVGALIQMGDGAVVRSASLTTTGTANSPVIFERSGSLAWSGIELRGQLWEGPFGLEGHHHLAHTRIIGADVGVDVKTEWATLSHVELIENGVGLISDYFMKCDGMLCGSAPSVVSLGHVLVEGSVSHGLYVRNADAYLGWSTINGNGGYGVYVQNAIFKSFFENVISQNGPLARQMEGLRVANNGEVSTGRRGDTVGWPGLNRFDDNVQEIGYLSGAYFFMGEDFDQYGPVGHFNTITSSSRGCWILNNSGTTLMAQVNYWGDESGPPSNAFCGLSPVSYEPVHHQDETGDSGGDYRPAGSEGVLAVSPDSGSSSARGANSDLGDRIRRVRSQLANNPESPSASARVRRLTVLHRQDVGDQTGEWAESYAVLTQVLETLLDQDPSQLPPGLRRAAERSAAALLRVALAQQEYEAADELLATYNDLIVGSQEARELALSAINVDEVFGRYDQAINRIDALINEIGTEDEGLVADLEFMAAVIAAKRDEAGDAGRGAPPETPFAATQAAGSSTMTFHLGPAFPNPTAGGTELPLMLPEASNVMVAVYDVLGRRVAVLVDGRLDAGQHRMHFASGAVSAGLYVVRAELVPDAGAPHVFTRRVTVVR